jgi:hypothetical protein
MLDGLAYPFPGLRPFESTEEAIFRGRLEHTDQLLRRLSEHRLLALVGTSGSGKSSLVRAGLLPALERGYLAGTTSRWRVAVMRPGTAPIDNLAEALRGTEAQQAAIKDAEADLLRSSRLGLVEAVQGAGFQRGESLIIVADQFEETFRQRRQMLRIDGGLEASTFVNLLLTAVNRPDAPVYVVLTMRSDFLGDCAQFPGLPEALSESQYLVPRLTREQRRQAIEEPLRLFGVSMTSQLVERLLNDSAEQKLELNLDSDYRGPSDPLPVLQHALMRTYIVWKSEDAKDAIDLCHYREAGTMESALDKHAEFLFGKLDQDGQIVAERIFRCITTTELGRPIRRPTPLADVFRIIGARAEDQTKVDNVLGVFRERENSFIQYNRDKSVDIVHESLIWKWKRLGDWVKDEAGSAELYRDLVKDAHGDATWGEPKLSSTLARRNKDAWNRDWAQQYAEDKFAQVELLLKRSRKAVRRQKWLRWIGIGIAAGAVVLAFVLAQKSRELSTVQRVRDGLARDLDERSKQQDALAAKINSLNSKQGTTAEERDRIAKEKADLEAQYTRSLQDSQRLNGQLQQATDLQATVKTLESQLQAAQQERDRALKTRDDESARRKDLESRVAQLESTLKTRPTEPEHEKSSIPVRQFPLEVAPEDAVKQALEKYREAYEKKDLKALAAIWPDGPLKQFQKTFDVADKIIVELDTPTIAIYGDAATVTCKQITVIEVNGKRAVSDSATRSFLLNKVQGSWVIVHD